MLNPDFNDYQLTSIINECCGGGAVVYSALYKPSKQYVAVKRYFVDKSKENANLIQVKIYEITPCFWTVIIFYNRVCLSLTLTVLNVCRIIHSWFILKWIYYTNNNCLSEYVALQNKLRHIIALLLAYCHPLMKVCVTLCFMTLK